MTLFLDRSNNNLSSNNQNVKCDIFDNSPLVKTTVMLALSVVILMNLVGNTLIIITVYKHKELRRTVNYFIVNVAFSDLIYALCDISVEATNMAKSSIQWLITGTAGLVFCKLTYYMGHISVSVSVGSCIWIALDRFVAVVLPMKAHLLSTRFRTYAIVSTWLAAIAVNLPDMFAYELAYDKHTKETSCKSVSNDTWSFMDGETHLYLIHVFPMAVLALLYCLIAVMLRKKDKTLSGANSKTKMNPRKRRAFRMSLCILAAFYICTLPITVQNTFQQYNIKLPCKAEKPLSFIGNLMFFLSTSINPVICFAFIGSYRNGLREIVHSWLDFCGCQRSREKNPETARIKRITPQNVRFIMETGV
ncbi:neuropeptide Y receptor type 1-like [Acropora muricata]|uniref:neuropeptide Y receptor type 1-like n=1 Tax=Acropora muricata TaxID=159855 RepID=UPI0034E460CC